jgi:hypothetical protein
MKAQSSSDPDIVHRRTDKNTKKKDTGGGGGGGCFVVNSKYWNVGRNNQSSMIFI